MKRFPQLFFYFTIMCTVVNGQSGVFSLNQQKIALRKYDKEVSQFWELGLYLIIDLRSQTSESKRDTLTEKQSSLRQNLRFGLFVARGKQKYSSDKWSLWLLTSFSVSPDAAPLWQKNSGMNKSKDYRISFRFSSSLELDYRLNERISFFSQAGFLLLTTTTAYTKFSNGTKDWRFTFSGRLGGSNLQLARVGMNYWFK